MLTCALNQPSARHCKRASFGLFISVSLGAVAVGCGSDDAATTPGMGAPNLMGTAAMGATGAGMGATGAGMTGNAMAGTAGTGAPAGPFTATVVESVNENPITSTQLPLTVQALDNQTGAPLGQEMITNDSATVTFTGLPNPVGFKIVGVPAQAIDTYTFNVDTAEQGRLLRVVAKSSVETVKTVANVTLSPNNADVAGAIYWRNAQGLDEPVGCATVMIDGAGDIRYFARNNLPTTDVALPQYPDLEVRASTNPLNGRFFIANVTPGAHTITAMLNGQAIGTASLPAFQSGMSTDGENAISLTDITLTGAANPTPADCM